MQQNEPTFYIGLNIDGFKLIRHIGSGGTAEVWEVEDANLNRWAMKIFSPTRGMDESAIRLFKLEFVKTEKLVHPNILRARKYGEYQNRPYIIFNLCDTSMMKILQERIHASRVLNVNRNALFSESELADIIYQVAQSLVFLHEKNIVHQDIKPDNILVQIDAEGRHTYMISDFGVSTDIKMTILRDSQILSDSNKGLTPDYASPELYQGAVLPETDIFALGITLFELCMGRPPISNSSMTTAIALLNNNGFIPDLPIEFSQRFNTLVHNCLELYPEDRPSAAKLFEWATFYKKEQYWPDEISQSRKDVIKDQSLPKLETPTTSSSFNLKRIVKPVLGISFLVAIGVLLYLFVWPLFFNNASKIMHALNSLDIEKAADIYDELNAEEKEKLLHLEYLSTVILSRIENVNDRDFMIIKEKNTQKLGLIDKKGELLIPLEYDKILRIIDPSVVTVKKDNDCMQFDLLRKTNLGIGKCKVYKSKQDYLKDF